MRPNQYRQKHWFWPDRTEEYDIMSNKTTHEEGVLKTSDPIRAAALLSFGISLRDAVPSQDGEKLVFVFDDSNQAARLASACFLQDRQVGIQTFVTNLRRTRELCYQWRLSGKGEK